MKFGIHLYMKKILILAFFSLCLGKVFSQDRQFTQFYASPLTLNPALSGMFEGKYRVGAIYRDQWRGLLDKPYQTFSFGADLRLEPFRSNVSKDRIGVGLLFFKDKINALDFTTTQMAISTAYHKALDIDNSQFLSAGFQIGLTQRNLNYENLTFQDQWNGTDKFSGRSEERLPENNFGFSDFSAGLNYTANFEPKTSLFLGASIHHFNRPNVSFYKGESFPSIPLNMRYSLQMAMNFPVNRGHTFFMSPRIIASSQGQHLTMNAGTNFRLNIDKTYNTALHFGSWARPVKGIDGIKLDAVVVMGGIEFNGVLLGLSYDLNLPNLKNYRRSQNVFEISLVYLGSYDADELLCPSF
jgi:type IX secretion system PorP/SprF family membrane protein